MTYEIPLFMMPGGPELLIVFFIAVLLFGSAKLPGLARAAGESMGEFQKGRVAVERELDEIRRGSTTQSTIDDKPSTDAAVAEPGSEPSVDAAD
ncbi:twin-arginine translocase TatA/TatE family subunit [Natronorubrum sp. JWXQ-INN-674]|uniref:Twin-arginine translocase TatA/TatE family subunit n=1 Tax=Natronorubrum halalkaliphilum TaxID=2691917 RepID=A0A6B0VPM0_9EURY|nr:twin-arginine translocase TatA/TatE family subunit [Natronorubrum halalkaliphilum]MXV63215.1 twin-arginine translocase TatA/TatE family subunit [Natronorubrum halalkaliphilum]